MAIAVNLLTSGSAAATDTGVTASVSPSGDALVLLAVTGTNFAGADPMSVSGNGLTWVQYNSASFVFNGGTGSHLTLFRAMGASPSTGAITISYLDGAQDAFAWSVVEFTGVDTTGTNGSGAVVQNSHTSGSSTTPSITLSAFGSSDNASYAAIGIYGTDAISPEAGWTELHEVTSSPTYAHIETEWGSNDTTPSATIAASSPWGIIGLEIKAAATGVTVNPTGVSSTPAVGSAVGANSLAQTGVSSTPATGTLSLSKSIAPTGTSSTGETGTSSLSFITDVTGNATTGDIGSVTTSNNTSITGTESTGAVGTVGVTLDTSLSLNLSGIETTGAIGNVTLSHTFVLSGAFTTPDIGSVVYDAGYSAQLSGLESTSALGSLLISKDVSITGIASTAAIGSLTSSATVSEDLVGNSSSTAVGSLGITGADAATVETHRGGVSGKPKKRPPEPLDYSYLDRIFANNNAEIKQKVKTVDFELASNAKLFEEACKEIRLALIMAAQNATADTSRKLFKKREKQIIENIVAQKIVKVKRIKRQHEEDDLLIKLLGELL